jgi:hypothetical protein
MFYATIVQLLSQNPDLVIFKKLARIVLKLAPFKGNFPRTAEIQPGWAIFSSISVLVLFALRVFYHETILQFEAYLMFKIFSIDPESYTQSILPFIAAAIILLWFALKSFRKTKE